MPQKTCKYLKPMKIQEIITLLHNVKHLIKNCIILKNRLKYCGRNTIIEYPFYVDSPNGIFLEENVKIRHNCKFINSPTEKIFIKKYSVLAPGCTIISNSHISTVGIPQFLLGASHINDKSKDVVIEEDVWIGGNVTILPGVKIGRGAIIGACSLVTKDIPPYALAVGSPARIVQKIFEIKDVLRHETLLYPPAERFTEAELTNLFETKYKGFKTYGINAPLTNEQLNILQKTKKDNNYITNKMN